MSYDTRFRYGFKEGYSEGYREGCGSMQASLDRVTEFKDRAVGMLALCEQTITEASKVLDTLPKTKDGIAIHLGRIVYSPRDYYVQDIEVVTWAHAAYLGGLTDTYSTYELAEEKLNL
jgi:hypothetical protein